MIAGQLAAILLGFGVMVVASRRAVTAASALAAGSKLPPFFVGITLLAIGTDLPEIANSIVASINDHGDVNVGDSVGSAATQITLILGLLPFIVGAVDTPKKGIVPTGVFTILALTTLAVVLSDGELGRIDGAVLIVLWVAGSWVTLRETSHDQQLTMEERSEGRWRLAGETLAGLAVVGVAANVALWGIVGAAEQAGVPELVASFVIASIGTSLPELVFDVTALRRGAVGLAVGDIFGSSFVDATLSVGIGPMVAPTDITVDWALAACAAAAAAVLVGTFVASRFPRLDRKAGALLIGAYLVIQGLVVNAAI